MPSSVHEPGQPPSGATGERLSSETGMPIVIADNPLLSVVHGSGICLENFDVLKHVLSSPARQ